MENKKNELLKDVQMRAYTPSFHNIIHTTAASEDDRTQFRLTNKNLSVSSRMNRSEDAGSFTSDHAHLPYNAHPTLKMGENPFKPSQVLTPNSAGNHHHPFAASTVAGDVPGPSFI